MGGGRQHLNSRHLRIDQNHPVTCGITRKTAKSRRPPVILILKIGSWILNTWLNQDFEYSAQSRFWILLFGPDLTWRLEIGGWGIGRGGEGFGLCSRGACGPLGGFQSQTSGQEQADYTTFNPTSSSTSCQVKELQREQVLKIWGKCRLHLWQGKGSKWIQACPASTSPVQWNLNTFAAPLQETKGCFIYFCNFSWWFKPI